MKWLLDYLDNQFFMILTYFHLTLDRRCTVSNLEEEPVYMDVEELRPSLSSQKKMKDFIAVKPEQSWPTVILSTNMTFRRKVGMQN